MVERSRFPLSIQNVVYTTLEKVLQQKESITFHRCTMLVFTCLCSLTAYVTWAHIVIHDSSDGLAV